MFLSLDRFTCETLRTRFSCTHLISHQKRNDPFHLREQVRALNVTVESTIEWEQQRMKESFPWAKITGL